MRHADSVELLENILQDTVPMHSRMIHGRRKDGKVFQESQAYDTHGRVSYDRAFPIGLRCSSWSSTTKQSIERASTNECWMSLRACLM